MKQILRTAAIGAALAFSLVGCTGTSPLTSAIGAATGTTPGATPTTAPVTTTPAGAVTAPAGSRQTATGTCTSTTPALTPDLLSGTAYGSFNGQHVPNGWAAAYTTQKQVWDAINSTPDNVWACFPSFYGGAYKVYNDLAATSGN